MKRTKRFTPPSHRPRSGDRGRPRSDRAGEAHGVAHRSRVVEIPYLSGGVGVSHMDFDPSSGRQRHSRAPRSRISATACCPTAARSRADDLTLSRPSNQGSPTVGSSARASTSARTVGGFGLALVLLIGGSALVIRHSRKTRLSPA